MTDIDHQILTLKRTKRLPLMMKRWELMMTRWELMMTRLPLMMIRWELLMTRLPLMGLRNPNLIFCCDLDLYHILVDLATYVSNFRLIGRQLTILETVKKSQLSLTSRDEKTWLRTSTGVQVQYFRSGFRQRTFCNQLEVSTTYDPNAMAHYVFFMFGVILTLTFDLSRSLFLCGVNIEQLVSTQNIEYFLWLSFCDMTVP